jgi:hypothetical protein
MKYVYANNKVWLLLLLTFSQFLSSCKDEQRICCGPPPFSYGFDQGVVDIDSADIRVILASYNDSLYTGYQELNLVFFDKKTSQVMNVQDVKINPLMDMGMMKHSAPFEQNSTTTDQGQLSFNVVFIMPNIDMAKWTIQVSFVNESGKEFQIEFEVNVRDPKTSTLYQFLDSAQKPYFVSLLKSNNFALGENPFELTVHSRLDMMHFPSEEDLQISIEPWMPTMGHGSPNNTDPVHVQDGHYEGKVNFTMTGLWQIKVRISRNGSLVTPEFFFQTTL